MVTSRTSRDPVTAGMLREARAGYADGSGRAWLDGPGRHDPCAGDCGSGCASCGQQSSGARGGKREVDPLVAGMISAAYVGFEDGDGRRRFAASSEPCAGDCGSGCGPCGSRGKGARGGETRSLASGAAGGQAVAVGTGVPVQHVEGTGSSPIFWEPPWEHIDWCDNPDLTIAQRLRWGCLEITRELIDDPDKPRDWAPPIGKTPGDLALHKCIWDGLLLSDARIDEIVNREGNEWLRWGLVDPSPDQMFNAGCILWIYVLTQPGADLMGQMSQEVQLVFLADDRPANESEPEYGGYRIVHRIAGTRLFDVAIDGESWAPDAGTVSAGAIGGQARQDEEAQGNQDDDGAGHSDGVSGFSPDFGSVFEVRAVYDVEIETPGALDPTLTSTFLLDYYSLVDPQAWAGGPDLVSGLTIMEGRVPETAVPMEWRIFASPEDSSTPCEWLAQPITYGYGYFENPPYNNWVIVAYYDEQASLYHIDADPDWMTLGTAVRIFMQTIADVDSTLIRLLCVDPEVDFPFDDLPSDPVPL